MVIEVPSPFPYRSKHAVPWNYDCNIVVQDPKEKALSDVTESLAAIDITGSGGITRSGRCYTPTAHEADAGEYIVFVPGHFLGGN